MTNQYGDLTPLGWVVLSIFVFGTVGLTSWVLGAPDYTLSQPTFTERP